MSILGCIALVAFIASIMLIVEGAAALWSDSGNDEQRADGIVTAGSGAALLFCLSGAFIGVELG